MFNKKTLKAVIPPKIVNYDNNYQFLSGILNSLSFLQTHKWYFVTITNGVTTIQELNNKNYSDH